MRLLNILLISLLIISCNDKNQQKSKTIIQPKIVVNDSIIETYIDSTSIGLNGLYKLELKGIEGKDSSYVDILFSEKINKQWKIKQHLKYEKDKSIMCFPKFKDFNNDGYNDFTYKSVVSARGSNDLKNLFIFSPDKGILVRIKNSIDYPNLEYNVELDCLNSTAYHGSYSYSFLKIKNDQLVSLAKIDHFDGIREVYHYDENNTRHFIKRDSFNIAKKGFIAYRNFKPLIEY
ncbi:hypothetical protein [uncultured Flavobacterium sp.]|uniref:hypothetical protein n=1 Tax=uncultured Flavobacterium sp. TaxID=165435 RepID=UPI0025FE7586|nr:hypothetical protein [uncultured Flavobacterium sp.]